MTVNPRGRDGGARANRMVLSVGDVGRRLGGGHGQRRKMGMRRDGDRGGARMLVVVMMVVVGDWLWVLIERSAERRDGGQWLGSLVVELGATVARW